MDADAWIALFDDALFELAQLPANGTPAQDALKAILNQFLIDVQNFMLAVFGKRYRGRTPDGLSIWDDVPIPIGGSGHVWNRTPLNTNPPQIPSILRPTPPVRQPIGPPSSFSPTFPSPPDLKTPPDLKGPTAPPRLPPPTAMILPPPPPPPPGWPATRPWPPKVPMSRLWPITSGGGILVNPVTGEITAMPGAGLFAPIDGGLLPPKVIVPPGHSGSGTWPNPLLPDPSTPIGTRPAPLPPRSVIGPPPLVQPTPPELLPPGWPPDPPYQSPPVTGLPRIRFPRVPYQMQPPGTGNLDALFPNPNLPPGAPPPGAGTGGTVSRPGGTGAGTGYNVTLPEPPFGAQAGGWALIGVALGGVIRSIIDDINQTPPAGNIPGIGAPTSPGGSGLGYIVGGPGMLTPPSVQPGLPQPITGGQLHQITIIHAQQPQIQNWNGQQVESAVMLGPCIDGITVSGVCRVYCSQDTSNYPVGNGSFRGADFYITRPPGGSGWSGRWSDTSGVTTGGYTGIDFFMANPTFDISATFTRNNNGNIRTFPSPLGSVLNGQGGAIQCTPFQFTIDFDLGGATVTLVITEIFIGQNINQGMLPVGGTAEQGTPPPLMQA